MNLEESLQSWFGEGLLGHLWEVVLNCLSSRVKEGWAKHIITCVTSNKLVHLFVPQFLHLLNRAIIFLLTS